MAAKDLADATHLSLESVGVLHEEIINTGGMNLVSKIDPEIGSENRGRGKVLFLVKHISHSEAARLGAFGFRFTTPSNVYDVLSRTMEVSKTEITKAIKDMSALQPDRESLHDEGVYIGCFAVKPEVVKGGFDILVQDASTSRIPTRSIGIPSFSAPHYRFLKKIHGKTAGEIVSFPSNIVDAAETSGLTETFAVHFTEAVSLLLGDLKDNYFANAVLDTNPQYIPTTGSISQLIVFKIMVPIHVSLSTPGLTFTPFLFFSTQQRSYPGCSEHEVHVRRVHREFSGRATPTSVGPRGTSLAKRMFKDRDPLKLAAIGRSMASSSRSPSVSSEKHLVIDDRFLSAGIMVSQSVTVEVAKEQANSTDTRPLGPSVDVMKLDETSDVLTWCEVLFKGVIEDMKIRDTTR